MEDNPILGVIGGSGFYNFSGLTDTQTVEIETPFGRPSAPIVIGTLNQRRVAFLARHGIGHTLLPAEVNYRANIYALKTLGVQFVVGVSACGSLRHDFEPGQMVVPDQVVDFTRGRKSSFFGDGLVVHVGVADPFCKELSALLVTAADQGGASVHKGGAFITIEGPRFSTRAESNLFRAWGITIVGMTACPEAFLAREAELSYATLAHITDYDVWHITEAPVSVDMVVRTLGQNTEKANQTISNLVGLLPDHNDCSCTHALADAIITNRAHINLEARQKLGVLVEKYLNA
ncbi:MAG TPA: S-methyl-5'-thioadenosine phosphorylase [Bellilinea sp.]|nr:S-methyl-5'-thioadenosine phosphorylase [Bellilinea sp.]